LHYLTIYNIILVYTCHVNHNFYLILIFGKLVRVLESSLRVEFTYAKRIEINSQVVKPLLKTVSLILDLFKKNSDNRTNISFIDSIIFFTENDPNKLLDSYTQEVAHILGDDSRTCLPLWSE